MQQLLSSSASAQRARHQSEPSSSDGRYEEARQQWRNAHTLGSSDEEDTSINPSTGLTARRETALQVMQAIDTVTSHSFYFLPLHNMHCHLAQQKLLQRLDPLSPALAVIWAGNSM